MFGSTILDVLIGLVTVFLVLSLAATALREVIETVLKTRAVLLERAIREMLGDADGGDLVRRFYQHPLIYPLHRNDDAASEPRLLGHNLPTYIPSATFSATVLDMAVRGVRAGPYAAAHTAPILTVDELRRAVARIPSARLRHALSTAIDQANGDLARLRRNLEAWFDATMGRISGRYRRQTQVYLFAIGVLLAASLNVNTVAIANHLWVNPAARQQMVSAAERMRTDTTYQRLLGDTAAAAERQRRAYQDFSALDLPIGWNRMPPRPAGTGSFDYYFQIVIGIAITALAIMLGAPFWFDALNKFMVVRSTVKPQEKAPEEGSKDRQAAIAPQVLFGDYVAAAQQVGSGGAQPADSSRAGGVTAPVPGFVDYAPRRWAFGDPDEGVL